MQHPWRGKHDLAAGAGVRATHAPAAPAENLAPQQAWPLPAS